MNLRPAVPTSAPDRRRSRARVPLAALGLALVVALGGCTIPGFGSPSSGSETDSDTGSGAEWFRYEQGEKVESASRRPAPPATSAPATSTPPAVATPVTSTPTCPTRLDPVTKSLGATGGAGQGTLTWDHVADPRIVEYRVAAVLQDFEAGEDVSTRTWITVARPATGCEEMTATVSGLIAGRYYVFWLDAVLALPDGTTREPMIGRSNAVLVL